MNKGIGSVLKIYWKQNQFTQEDVARKLNISRQAISAWENNQSYPDIENLVLLSQLYHVPIEQLIQNLLKKEDDGEKSIVFERNSNKLETLIGEIDETGVIIMKHLQWLVKKGKILLVATEIILIITVIYTLWDLLGSFYANLIM